MTNIGRDLFVNEVFAGKDGEEGPAGGLRCSGAGLWVAWRPVRMWAIPATRSVSLLPTQTEANR